MATLRKRFSFEAAHFLPNHQGSCKKLHGHSYQFEVAISGEIQRRTGSSNDGMVLDFGEISMFVKEHIVRRFDHTFLNDVLSSTPTAENLALDIYSTIHSWFVERRKGGDEVSIQSITVWETPTSSAEVSYKDWLGR